MNKCKMMVVSFGVVAGLGGAAVADDAEDAVLTAGTIAKETSGIAADSPEEPRHSINLNASSVWAGYYNLNYEYLRGSHGLLVEGGFAHASAGDSSATSFGGGVGWRWHFRGHQNSSFLGVMAGFFGGSAESVATNDKGDRMSVDISLKELDLTMNLGKRWQFGNGMNVTFRLGGGYAKRWFSTSSTDPNAQEAVQAVEDLMAFLPIAFDSELSLGYTF